jgi:hypothetical protein
MTDFEKCDVRYSCRNLEVKFTIIRFKFRIDAEFKYTCRIYSQVFTS